MNEETKTCLFCDIPPERVITEDEHAYAIRDGFPITGGALIGTTLNPML